MLRPTSEHFLFSPELAVFKLIWSVSFGCQNICKDIVRNDSNTGFVEYAEKNLS